MGKQGCAALQLELLPWLYAGGSYTADGLWSPASAATAAAASTPSVSSASSSTSSSSSTTSSTSSSSASLVGLQRGAEWKVSYEVLGYLGDGNWSETSLRQAELTLDAMDVVGITERMDETMVSQQRGQVTGSR